MTNHWLVKQESSSYSFDTLEKEGTAVWDGVHNNLALKHINNMKKGDLAFFYYSGDERQIVGILEITSNPYPNPKEKDKRFVVVDVKHKRRLKRPVTLAEIKKEKKFKDWELLRISRLSVMPVPKEIWDKILEKSHQDS
ncbi:MAG: EVE domain-containing protein [Nitrosopumilales archaeon]|nr:EVE domain-containing protein [Nitrosopumilales archaeon]